MANPIVLLSLLSKKGVILKGPRNVLKTLTSLLGGRKITPLMDWTGILADLIKVVLGAALLFVCASFWRQPKVEVQYKEGAGGTRPGSTSNTLLWFLNIDLILYNLGPHDAFDLRAEIRPNQKPVRVNEIGQKHLRATDSFKIHLDVQQELPKDDILAARSTGREKELGPGELRNLECRLSYKNRWGKRFYTRFRRTETGDVVTYHRWKPRFRVLFYTLEEHVKRVYRG